MGLTHLPLAGACHLLQALTSEQRPIIAGDALLKGYLPLFEQALADGVAAASASRKEPALKAAKRACADANQRHDAALRLLWLVLHAEIARAQRGGDDDRARSVEEIIGALFPVGLNQLNRTHFAKGSEPQLLFGALLAAQVAMLKTIVFQGETALDIALEWLAAAEALSDAVRHRAILEAAEPPISGADRLAARRKALKVLRLFLDALPHSGLDDPARAALIAPIKAAIATVTREPKEEGQLTGDSTVGFNGSPPLATEPPMAQASAPAARGEATEPRLGRLNRHPPPDRPLSKSGSRQEREPALPDAGVVQS